MFTALRSLAALSCEEKSRKTSGTRVGWAIFGILREPIVAIVIAPYAKIKGTKLGGSTHSFARTLFRSPPRKGKETASMQATIVKEVAFN